MKEWKGMDCASKTRASENWIRWKEVVGNSPVVPKRHSSVIPVSPRRLHNVYQTCSKRS